MLEAIAKLRRAAATDESARLVRVRVGGQGQGLRGRASVMVGVYGLKLGL